MTLEKKAHNVRKQPEHAPIWDIQMDGGRFS